MISLLVSGIVVTAVVTLLMLWFLKRMMAKKKLGKKQNDSQRDSSLINKVQFGITLVLFLFLVRKRKSGTTTGKRTSHITLCVQVRV